MIPAKITFSRLYVSYRAWKIENCEIYCTNRIFDVYKPEKIKIHNQGKVVFIVSENLHKV